MNKINLLSAAFVIGIAGLVYTAPAQAQATRTWVSGVGDDLNPCSRTAPCKTFAGAISKTATHGEINCLDPAGYGAVTVVKSITIDCEDTQGSILAANVTGVIVNASAARVVIRGLSINGAGTSTGNGIRMLQAGALVVDKVIIHGFQGTGVTNGNGIKIENPSGTAEVFITDTKIVNNGSVALRIVPTGTGAVNVTVDNSNFSNNESGIRGDTLASSGVTNITVTDTVLSGNLFQGFVVESGTGVIRAMLSGVTSSNNGAKGVRVLNGNSTVFFTNSQILGNALGTESSNGGLLRSFGNNRIEGNTDNGPNPSVIPQK